MQHSETIDQIAAALSALTAEMVDARKDIQGYGYKYADLAQHLAIARPLLSKHGLAIVQSPSAEGDTVTVTTLLMHKSGQWISDSMSMLAEPKKGLSQAQCAGTVISYCRRYALSCFLQMAADDSDATEGKDSAELSSPVLGRLMTALEATDGIALYLMAQRDESGYRQAFGRLNAKQKGICRTLEHEGAVAVMTYIDELKAAAVADDTTHALQLWAELVDPDLKRLVWAGLDADSRTWVKQLKEVA